jgi:tryptophan-rich sensory protein
VICPAVFFILVLYTTFLFFEVDATAGYLMLPYVAWVAFANLLNISFVEKN